MEIIRNNVDDQFLGTAMYCPGYSGGCADSPVLCKAVDEVWRAFDGCSVMNKIVAAIGDRFSKANVPSRFRSSFLCVPLQDWSFMGPSCTTQLVHAPHPNRYVMKVHPTPATDVFDERYRV